MLYLRDIILESLLPHLNEGELLLIVLLLVDLRDYRVVEGDRQLRVVVLLMRVVGVHLIHLLLLLLWHDEMIR